MKVSRRSAAISMALVLAVSACSGGETLVESAQGQPAAEVPEQSAETTTTVEATTEPAEPPAAIASAAEEAESPVSGSSLSEVDSLFAGLLGPTDDFTAAAERVAPFPALTTLPDTEITGVEASFNFNEDSDEFGYSLDVEFAALGGNAEETIAAYGAELSAAAGETPNFHTVETQTGDQIDDVFWAQIGDTSINAFDRDGGTVVSVDITVNEIPEGLLDSLDGIPADLGFNSDDVRTIRVLAVADSRRYNISYRFADTSLGEAQALFDGAAEAAGWESVNDSSTQWSSPDHDAEIQTSLRENESNGSASAAVQYIFQS